MAPAPALVRRPAGSNGSLTGARVVRSRSSVHVPDEVAGACLDDVSRVGTGTGRFPSAGRSTSPSPRSGALEGGEGASWAPYGLSRQGSGGLRGRSRPRHDPLEVGGQGCPDDAAQRVERPAAATTLDDPKAGTRESRLADVERSPRARPGRVPVIEGREERRVTAGRREQLPHAGRRASAVLRPATTAADDRGRTDKS